MSTSAIEFLALAVSFISMIATGAAGIYAGRAAERARAANQIAEASLRFQVLLPAVFEYRSAEMLVAVRSLWDFARAHPNEIADAFRAQREADQQHLATLRGEEHLNYLRTTLDFHRRQVSQFYGFLTAVYDEGGIQRKWIYTLWSRSDLEIIPKVIVPMEQALGQAIGSPASPTSLDRLLKLYQESPPISTASTTPMAATTKPSMPFMRNLNGWQRLWLVLTGAAFIYAMGWGFVQGSSGGGERVNEKVVAAFANPSCQTILKLPAQTKLTQEPGSESPCWDLYLYRSIYENASSTADGYVKDIETRRRNWMLGTMGIALGIWVVGSLVAYAIGLLTAWVGKGFVQSREHL